MNDEQNKPGRYAFAIDQTLGRSDNPPTNEQMIEEIAQNIARQQRLTIKPDERETDRITSEIYQVATALLEDWLKQAAANLAELEKPENYVVRSLAISAIAARASWRFDIDTSANTGSRGLYNNCRIELYFIANKADFASRIPPRPGANSIFLNYEDAARGFAEFMRASSASEVLKDFRIFVASGQVRVQPAAPPAPVRFVKVQSDTPFEISTQDGIATFKGRGNLFVESWFLGRIYDLVHAGQRTGELLSISQLSKALKVDEKMIYKVCQDEGLNINVAIGCGGVAKLDRSDHTVEDLSFDPLAKPK